MYANKLERERWGSLGGLGGDYVLQAKPWVAYLRNLPTLPDSLHNSWHLWLGAEPETLAQKQWKSACC